VEHNDFRIGLDFYTATGAWRCTDIGTRVVTAITVDVPDLTVLAGPPYAVGEFVIDENYQRVASLRPQPVLFTGSQTPGRVIHGASASTTVVLEREIRQLRRVCAEAYQFARVVGAPARVLNNLHAAAEGKPLPHPTFLPVSADECFRLGLT